MRYLPFCMAPLVGLALSGCAPQQKYNWGGYSETMIAMNENPAATADYAASLKKIIDDPDKKVPPGIFAEYGYILQQKGDAIGAAAMYQREKAAWPESSVLMDRMTQSLAAGKPAV